MNRARMFLPPPEIPLARFLVSTLAAISFRALSSMGYQCSIVEGFNDEKMLEFIEITCEDDVNVDCIVATFWSIKGNSITKPAWESIKLVFDEKSQVLKYDAGGFPGGKYRYLQDILLAQYTKYIFGRGFAMEAMRREIVKRSGKSSKPRAEGGYIDFSLRNAIPYLYGLDTLRRSLRLVYNRRVVHLLLADLGDQGIGLLEAVEKLYNPTQVRDCIESVCEKGSTGKGKRVCLAVQRPNRTLNLAFPSEKLSVDLGLWIGLSLKLSLVELVLEGSIELVSRWPSIAFTSYTAGTAPSKDNTRNLSINILSPDDVIASMQGLEAAAEDLGLTSLSLARGLRRVLGCASDLSRGTEKERSAAGALLGRAIPLINSILHGFVDRDMYYYIVRMLNSIVSSSDAPYSCRSASSML